MTTPTKRLLASPPGAVGTRELRLYLIALLAAAYVTAWWHLGLRAPTKPTDAGAIELPPAASAAHGIATWFYDLPAAERPVVNLPAGWHIAGPPASSPAVTTRAVPVPARVSLTRAKRIRTRSS